MAKATENSTRQSATEKELLVLSLHIEHARHVLMCARSVLHVMRDDRCGINQAGVAAAAAKLVEDASKLVERTGEAIRRLTDDN